jgi:hypothetical protein
VLLTKGTHRDPNFSSESRSNNHDGEYDMTLQFTARLLPQNDSNPIQDDRPKAQVWLNIGTTVPVPIPETGEVEDVFVALPVGIPLDTMEHMEVRGTNQNWHHLVQAKNWLLEQLQQLAEGVDAGGEELIDGLQVQIKRVGQAPAPAADQNPFLSAMRGRLSVVK